jgi:hypothetical protein
LAIPELIHFRCLTPAGLQIGRDVRGTGLTPLEKAKVEYRRLGVQRPRRTNGATTAAILFSLVESCKLTFVAR